jgi:hypothetical protein
LELGGRRPRGVSRRPAGPRARDGGTGTVTWGFFVSCPAVARWTDGNRILVPTLYKAL